MGSQGSATAHADAGKGSKKKGPALEPAHLLALREATDCLKVLTLWPEVAFIAAKAGLLPALVGLLDSPDLTLRRNAHMIIGAVLRVLGHPVSQVFTRFGAELAAVHVQETLRC